MSKNNLKISNINNEQNNFAECLEKLVGKILVCKTKDDTTFASKLIAVKGEMLIFETSKGRIVVDNINELVSASEYTPKEAI